MNDPKNGMTPRISGGFGKGEGAEPRPELGRLLAEQLRHDADETGVDRGHEQIERYGDEEENHGEEAAAQHARQGDDDDRLEGDGPGGDVLIDAGLEREDVLHAGEQAVVGRRGRPRGRSDRGIRLVCVVHRFPPRCPIRGCAARHTDSPRAARLPSPRPAGGRITPPGDIVFTRSVSPADRDREPGFGSRVPATDSGSPETRMRSGEPM